MGKSYQAGFDRGYKDACAGKSKVNARHLWAGIKNAINPLGSVEEFVRGYEEGYRIGLRDRARGACK